MFRLHGVGGAGREERREIHTAQGHPLPSGFSLPLSLWISFLLSLLPGSLPPGLFLCLLLSLSIFVPPSCCAPTSRSPQLTCWAPSVCLTLLSCPLCVCGSLSRPFLYAVPAAGEGIMEQATLPFILCQAKAGAPGPAVRHPGSHLHCHHQGERSGVCRWEQGPALQRLARAGLDPALQPSAPR